jgi:hypothetical protein
MKNVGATLRVAIGRINRGPEIAAGDNGSHVPLLGNEDDDENDSQG